MSRTENKMNRGLTLASTQTAREIPDARDFCSRGKQLSRGLHNPHNDSPSGKARSLLNQQYLKAAQSAHERDEAIVVAE